jgi:hypothetical protein
MKKYVIGLFLMMIFLLAASSALAITSGICSPKIVAWYYNVPASVQKTICIENDNAFPATVTLSASSEISSMISFSQTTVSLAVGEKKFVPFTVTISSDTLASGTINARFVVPQDTSGFPDVSGSAAFSTKKGECQSGATQACTDSNCTGTQTCTSNYQWGTCVKSGSCGGSSGCTESWSCSSWSPNPCTAGSTQTRTCTDSNSCGTTNYKPLTWQECSTGGTSCTESWSCGSWSPDPCTAGSTQTRSCTDSNNCGTVANKPSVSQSCSAATCTPSWSCTWTSCQPSGTKTASGCHDVNNCGLACTTANNCVTTLACTYSTGGGGGGSSGGGGGGGGGGGSYTKSET